MPCRACFVSSSATRLLPCVVCGADTLVCLNLAKQPLANALLGSSTEAYERYPLGLASCPECSHGQLTHFVPPERLFANYLYASGTGEALKPYFEWFAASLAASLRPGARVLEIACNDGSLLDCLRAAGLDACGVDPAANLTSLARSRGHHVLTGFFPETRPDGAFDAIIAMNVLAHTPDPAALMRGIRSLLKPDGIAIVQTSQAFMLINGEFDTIYHEHYSFFTPHSMYRLAANADLTLGSRHIVSVHGSSLISTFYCAGAPPGTASFVGGGAFDLPWPNPEPGILAIDPPQGSAEQYYRRFSERAQTVIKQSVDLIARSRRDGSPIALIGVAAKAMTFIVAAGITPDYFLDESALKCGRFVPGSSKAIQPLRNAAELDENTVFIIGAWNFTEQLAGKVRALRPTRNNRFVVFFPEIKEFS